MRIAEGIGRNVSGGMVGTVRGNSLVYFMEAADGSLRSRISAAGPSVNCALQNLLVLGDYPIGYPNGIGETLANLLEGYPEQRLFYSHPVHLRSTSGSVGGKALPFRAPRNPEWLPDSLGALGYPWLKVQQTLAERLVFRKVSHWIQAYGIRVILTYPVSPWLLFTNLRLRRAFPNVRFIFYVMDDWEGHHTCFGLPFTRKRRQSLADLIKTSDVRFACSNAMAQDYRQRFGTTWDVLHKGVLCTRDAPTRTTFRGFNRILYAGAINAFRFDAVIAFAEGLQLYRKQTGRNVTLQVLGTVESADLLSALDRFDCVTLSPWVDSATCIGKMAEADLLYLPLAFANKLERISNLAMPAKFPEYLASGRPIIFHVPKDSEVHKLVEGASLPLTLNSLDPQDTREMLLRLERDGIDSSDYYAKAWGLLRDEFDQGRLRHKLEQACTE